MRTDWNATFCYRINAGSSIEKKNKPHVKIGQLNWLFNLRQKGLLYHLDGSSDPKPLVTSEVRVMMWPLEHSQRFSRSRYQLKSLGWSSKIAYLRGGMFYSFYQELFLPSSSQSVYSADGGYRGSYVEQRALEQNSVQDLKAALYIWETDFAHVFDIAWISFL